MLKIPIARCCRFASAFLASALLGCLVSCSGELGEGAVTELSLGSHRWQLPPGWRVLSDAAGRSASAADTGASVLLRINFDQVQQWLPQYQVPQRTQASLAVAHADDLVVELSLLNAAENERYRDPEQFAELGLLWRGEGSYYGRQVEADFVSGGFKVFRTNEYPHSWTLLRLNPDAADAQLPADATQIWWGQCIRLAGSGKGQTTCATHFIQQDLLVSYDVGEVNLGLIDALAEVLWQQLMRAEKGAAGP